MYNAPGRKYALLVILAAFTALPLCAGQLNEEEGDDGRIEKPSTPIQPNIGKVWPSELGVLLGVGFNQQSGIFTSSCECKFTEGAASGFLAGLYYQKDLSRTLSWGIRLTYEQRGIDARFLEYESIQFVDPGSNQTFETDVRFRHEAATDITIFAFTPYLQWAPARFVYFQLGLSPHFVGSAELTHTKEVAQRTVRGPGGQILVPRIGDPPSNSVTIDDGEFPEMNSFQFAATLGAGFQIDIGQDFALLPMFQYVIPFTDLSNRGEGFRVSVGQLLLGFSHRLN